MFLTTREVFKSSAKKKRNCGWVITLYTSPVNMLKTRGCNTEPSGTTEENLRIVEKIEHTICQLGYYRINVRKHKPKRTEFT